MRFREWFGVPDLLSEDRLHSYRVAQVFCDMARENWLHGYGSRQAYLEALHCEKEAYRALSNG